VQERQTSSAAADRDEKLWAFLKVTGGLERWKERARTGLTDAQLEEALREKLGICGGSGGPCEPSISFQGAGLKICRSWDGTDLNKKPSAVPARVSARVLMTRNGRCNGGRPEVPPGATGSSAMAGPCKGSGPRRRLVSSKLNGFPSLGRKISDNACDDGPNSG